MKKIYLKIAIALLVSATVVTACKKEEAPATNCANVSASIVNDVTVYQNAITKYSSDPSTTNCLAVKSSLTVIINKIKDCPEFAQMKTQYETFLTLYTCEAR